MQDIFVTVDYEEWKPETYKGIIVSVQGVKRVVNTGDFKADYQTVCKEYAPFKKSSMIDHYMSDAGIKH